MSPEAVLAAIFTQAFSSGAARLPAGVTRADLRAALALEPDAQLRVYEQIRNHFRARANDLAKPGKRYGWFAGLVFLLALASVAISCLPRHSPVAPVRAVHSKSLSSSPPPPPAPAKLPVSQLLPLAAREPKMLAQLKSRAATGEADAAYALATLLDSRKTQDETTLPKDDQAAFALYDQAARAGHVEAEYAVGQAYQTGRGVTPDAALATAWYRAAALSGFAPAETSLGFAYQTGLGIARDDKEAAHWFSLAVAQSNPAGETALGYLYLYGQGVERNELRGVALFSRAAERHFGPALLALGFCYAQGLGVVQNISLAAAYFLRADQSGVPQAKSALAMLGPLPGQRQLATSAMQPLAGD
ncbi:tetratricopeptide repeat protein [Acidocella sp.]|uniref:tetratricopeptide repeat protein n=1 Tax=Acidocella sp. TaxID=50710 RepID=UPI003D043AAC